MKRDATSPQSYRHSVEGEQSALLEAIRAAILETVPGVKEAIAYGMLDYPGVANLAAQKHYVSLYVLPEVLARHLDRFPGVDAGKSCLRFRRLEQADPHGLRTLLRDVAKTRKRSATGGGAAEAD